MSRYIDADEIVYFNDTGEDRPIEAALVAYKGQIDRKGLISGEFHIRANPKKQKTAESEETNNNE